jgi:hypothetical protein
VGGSTVVGVALEHLPADEPPGSPRPGLCWYCARPWLRVGDPPDHLLLAALGSRLVTDRCCTRCNAALNARVDQPALADWLIALARRRAGLRDTRRARSRSRPAAPPEQTVTLGDGTAVVADLAHPDLVPAQVTRGRDGPLVVGGRAHERRALVDRVERTARERGRSRSVPDLPIPRELRVGIRADLRVLPRFVARAAFGALSLEGWSDDWLATSSAARLRGWLWDDEPLDDIGGPLRGLLRRPPWWAAQTTPPGGHLLAFHPGRDARAALHMVLFGRHWQAVIIDSEGQPTPLTVWRLPINAAPIRSDFHTVADELFRAATGRDVL